MYGPDGVCSRGKPETRWWDNNASDVSKFVISFTKAEDRPQWERVVKKAKGLLCHQKKYVLNTNPIFFLCSNSDIKLPSISQLNKRIRGFRKE